MVSPIAVVSPHIQSFEKYLLICFNLYQYIFVLLLLTNNEIATRVLIKIYQCSSAVQMQDSDA